MQAPLTTTRPSPRDSVGNPQEGFGRSPDVKVLNSVNSTQPHERVSDRSTIEHNTVVITLGDSTRTAARRNPRCSDSSTKRALTMRRAFQSDGRRE